MNTFYLGLFDHLRKIASDAGIKTVDFGGNFGDACLVVVFGNKEYTVRISEKEIEVSDDD